MMKHRTSTVLAVAGLLAAGGLLEAQVAPETGRPNLQSSATVSPGSPTGSLIGDPCPAFSWGEMAGVKSYQLAVYRLREEAEEDEEVLRETLPGAALSWTPSLDRCLERGGQYAWTVRAIARQGETGWASPSFFTVAPGAMSPVTVEETLAMARQYLADPGTPAAAKAPASSSGTRSPATRSPATRSPATVLGIDGNVDAVSFSGDGSALSGVVAEDVSCTDCVGSGDLAAGAVGSSEIATGAVSSSEKIVAGAVGSDEIATGAVGGDEIADGAVGASKIASGAVGSDEIADGAIGSSEIAGGAVGGSEIAIGSVGTDEIADGAVGGSEIVTGGVDSDDIPPNAVRASEIAAGAVGSDEIADGAVGSSEIADDAIRGGEIADVRIVHVECNGECDDSSLGDICDVAGAGWQPIGATSPNAHTRVVTTFCGDLGGISNYCSSGGELNRSTLLSSVAADASGTWDAVVFCINP